MGVHCSKGTAGYRSRRGLRVSSNSQKKFKQLVPADFIAMTSKSSEEIHHQRDRPKRKVSLTPCVASIREDQEEGGVAEEDEEAGGVGEEEGEGGRVSQSSFFLHQTSPEEVLQAIRQSRLKAWHSDEGIPVSLSTFWDNTVK